MNCTSLDKWKLDHWNCGRSVVALKEFTIDDRANRDVILQLLLLVGCPLGYVRWPYTSQIPRCLDMLGPRSCISPDAAAGSGLGRSSLLHVGASVARRGDIGWWDVPLHGDYGGIYVYCSLRGYLTIHK